MCINESHKLVESFCHTHCEHLHKNIIQEGERWITILDPKESVVELEEPVIANRETEPTSKIYSWIGNLMSPSSDN